MVKIISITIISIVLVVVGSLYYYTGGDFTKVGIPINLSAKLDSVNVENIKEEQVVSDTWKVHYEDGASYLDEGFYNEAIKEFKAVLRIDSENDKAKLGIATAHMKRGEEFSNLEFYDKASNEFKEVLKWAKKGSPTYNKAKKLLEDIKKYMRE
jgi:tetratricopeptide (TPR) repeat protein